jgi:hypothetical protein
LIELEKEKDEIEELTNKSTKKKKRLVEIEKEMMPLKKFLEDAKAQRRAQQLFNKEKIYTEWNMFFANLGHNICNSRAGHSRAPFIKKYHHFSYPRPGVLHCKYERR